MTIELRSISKVRDLHLVKAALQEFESIGVTDNATMRSRVNDLIRKRAWNQGRIKKEVKVIKTTLDKLYALKKKCPKCERLMTPVQLSATEMQFICSNGAKGIKHIGCTFGEFHKIDEVI